MTEISATSEWTYPDLPLKQILESEPVVERTILEDCNQNPNQYDFKGKLIFDKEQCVGTCYFEKITIYGTSMTPTIQDSTDLKFKMDKNLNLSIGEVIFYDTGKEKSKFNYTSPYKFYIHRIVTVQGDDLVVKGDNNDFCEVIPNGAVEGVLVSVYA